MGQSFRDLRCTSRQVYAPTYESARLRGDGYPGFLQFSFISASRRLSCWPHERRNCDASAIPSRVDSPRICSKISKARVSAVRTEMKEPLREPRHEMHMRRLCETGPPPARAAHREPCDHACRPHPAPSSATPRRARPSRPDLRFLYARSRHSASPPRSAPKLRVAPAKRGLAKPELSRNGRLRLLSP